MSPGETGSVSPAHASLTASFARVPKRAMAGWAASRARRSDVTVAGSGTSTETRGPSSSFSDAKSRTSTFIRAILREAARP